MAVKNFNFKIPAYAILTVIIREFLYFGRKNVNNCDVSATA